MKTKNICAICAWRETCQKKFSLSGKDMRCSDFVEDIAIKKGAQDSIEEKKDE